MAAFAQSETQRCDTILHAGAHISDFEKARNDTRFSVLAPRVRAPNGLELVQKLQLISDANSAINANDWVSFAAYIQKSLQLYMKTDGPGHPNTLTTEATLAFAMIHNGQQKEAIPLLENAYAGILPYEGRTGPDVIQLHYSIFIAHLQSEGCHAALVAYAAPPINGPSGQAPPTKSLPPPMDANVTPEELKRCQSQLLVGPNLQNAFADVFHAVGKRPQVRPPTRDEQTEMSRLMTDTKKKLTASTILEDVSDEQRLLDLRIATYGPTHPVTADSELGLGQTLLAADDAARAEPYLRASYAAWLADSGAKGASASAARVGLIESLLIQGQCRTINRLADGEAVKAPDLAAAITKLKSVNTLNDAQSEMKSFEKEMKSLAALQSADDFVGSVQQSTVMEAESRKTGEDGPIHQLAMFELGLSLEMAGKFQEAEPLLRRTRLDGFQAVGTVGFSWLPLVLISLQLDRMSDARSLLVPLAHNAVEARDPAGAFLPALLAQTDLALDRPEEAEHWATAAVSLSQVKPSVGTGGGDVNAIQVLARVLAAEGKTADAVKLQEDLRARLRRTSPKLAGRQHDLRLAQVDSELASLLGEGPRASEALALADEAVRLETAVYGTGAVDLLPLQVGRAYALLRAGRSGDALTAFRTTCQTLRSVTPTLPGERSISSNCEWGLAKAAMSQSAAVAEKDGRARFDEAFTAAQRALGSQAGSAVATAGARVRVAGSDAAALVGTYEASVARRNALDVAISNLASEGSEKASLARSALSSRRDAEDTTARDAARQISDRFPSYWTLVAQPPVSLDRLQRGENGGAPLLRADEALIIWMAPSRGSDGMVLAVSRKSQGWARMTMDGAALSNEVTMLRGQIDPCGYETHQSACKAGTAPSFSVSTAHRLYEALLGDSAIQSVVGTPEIKTLMIVPSGPLLALPPSVLVVADPGTDAARDVSAESMRATDWLIKHQAIAVLPSVSSLNTLRNSPTRPGSGRSIRTPGGLFMVADPDYGAAGVSPPSDCNTRSLSSFPERPDEVGSAALRKAIAHLCPLPGTRKEAKALMALLHGRSGDLLEGRDAREARLRLDPAKSRLENASVVAFATHGLMPGQLGLSEPALVLAAPLAAERDDDGLLTASKAAGLKLNAELVILSACNTASSDAPRSEGISGLSRAFFYAGAKSLLVSNWRIGDEEASLITSRTVALYASGANKAEALRQASLNTMHGADRTVDERDSLAFPSAWAPFTLVGEPD